MGKEIVLMKSEEKKSRQEVADFLKELADKVVEGKIVLNKGEEQLELDLPENLVLEIKAEEEQKHERMKYSFEVELEWYPGEDEGGGISLG